MHPILARSGRLGLYLGLWVLVGLLLAGLLAERGGLGWTAAAAVALPLSTAFSFVCLSAWYVARGMPLATTGALRIAMTAVTASLLSGAVWVVIAKQWISFVVRHLSTASPPAIALELQPLVFGFGVLLYLLSVAVSYLLAAFEASQEAQRRGLQIQVLAREAELRSLRAQIDPHFLFNSLHSISALTAVDPPGARRMCLLLADFLRDNLAFGAESRIPLARELGLVERFLAIEQVRFGDRLTAVIREYLRAHADVEVVGEYGNGFDAVKAVVELAPDLVFLDVQMPKLSGFEVVELLGRDVPVVFTTAYDQYALRAFEVHAVDYLLKPFNEARFAEALSRARSRLQSRDPAQGAGMEALVAAAGQRRTPVERVLIREGSQVHVLPVEKIDYVEAQDDYICFKAEGREYLKDQTMAALESTLDPMRFVRIHRSYVLNIERIARVELYAKDSRVAILRDGTRLPVSRAGYGRLATLL